MCFFSIQNKMLNPNQMWSAGIHSLCGCRLLPNSLRHRRSHRRCWRLHLFNYWTKAMQLKLFPCQDNRLPQQETFIGAQGLDIGVSLQMHPLLATALPHLFDDLLLIHPFVRGFWDRHSKKDQILVIDPFIVCFSPIGSLPALFHAGPQWDVILVSIKRRNLTFANSFRTIELCDILFLVLEISVQEDDLLITIPLCSALGAIHISSDVRCGIGMSASRLGWDGRLHEPFDKSEGFTFFLNMNHICLHCRRRSAKSFKRRSRRKWCCLFCRHEWHWRSAIPARSRNRDWRSAFAAAFATCSHKSWGFWRWHRSKLLMEWRHGFQSSYEKWTEVPNLKFEQKRLQKKNTVKIMETWSSKHSQLQGHLNRDRHISVQSMQPQRSHACSEGTESSQVVPGNAK